MGNKGGFWTWKTDAGIWLFGYFWAILVSTVMGLMLRPLIFRMKWLSPNVLSNVTLLIIFGGMFCFADLIPVVELPVWIEVFISGGYLLMYYVIKAYLNYKKYGAIQSKEEVSKISFWGKVDEKIIEDLPKIHKKRFEKINERMVKENKPLVSEEEYMEEFRKEVALDKKGNLVSTIVIIILVTAIGLGQIFQSGIADGALFVFLLLIIEIPIVKWTWNGYKRGPKETVLCRCEELGIGIVEYARGLEQGNIK